MDKRRLSKKRHNILRRARYRANDAWRSKMQADTRHRYQPHPEPAVFVFDGEDYVLLSRAARSLDIKYPTLFAAHAKGIIPQLPRHTDGRRYLIKLSNVNVISEAIKELLSDKEVITVKELRLISDYCYNNWNKSLKNNINIAQFNNNEQTAQ